LLLQQEFLAAEKIKLQIRDGTPAASSKRTSAKKRRGKAATGQAAGGNGSGRAFHAVPDLELISGGDTFALTSTNHEANEIARSQSSLSAHGVSVGSPSSMHGHYVAQPRASTALGMQNVEHGRVRSPLQRDGQVDILVPVDLCDVGTQCRPIEMEEAPVDRVLRRYSFSLEWDYGSLGPGLLNSANDRMPKQLQAPEENARHVEEESHHATGVNAVAGPAAAGIGGHRVPLQEIGGSVLDELGEARESLIEVKEFQHGALASEILDTNGATLKKIPHTVSHGDDDLKPAKGRRPMASCRTQVQKHTGHVKGAEKLAEIEAALEDKMAHSDHQPRRHRTGARPPPAPGSKRGVSPSTASHSASAKDANPEDAIAQQLRGRGRKRADVAPKSVPATGDTNEDLNDNVVHSVLSSSTLCSTATGRSKSPSARARTTATPAVGMRFYEVKLMEKETDPPIDYSVDYRRYSYTDFKIPERGEGKSTVDPELIADWIDRAVPRNQDDAHPLFVLCKDLLRKFHQKEIRYAVRKEQDMLAEILKLQEALGNGFQEGEALRRAMEEAAAIAKAELDAMAKEMQEMRVQMLALQEELERYKELEQEMIALRAQFHPGIWEELAHLRSDNACLIEQLHELMGGKDLERRKEVETINKALDDKTTAILALQNELEAEKARADSAEATVLALRNKKPIEHVEEWGLEEKNEIFRYFFTARRLIRRLKSASNGDKKLDGGSATLTEQDKDADATQEAKDETVEVHEQVASCMTEQDFLLLPPDLQFKCSLASLNEQKAASERPDAKNIGLKWQLLTEKPTSGTQLINAKLEEALTINAEFTPQELNKFKVSTNLTSASYVKVGDKYFKPLAQRSWLETICMVLGVTAHNAWQHVLHLVKEDPSLWKSTLMTHQAGEGQGWDLTRESLLQANIQLDSLAALEVLSGVEQTMLLAKIVGIDPKYIPMLREHWELFLKWFERFGAMENGLDAAEEERRRIREKVKKYALLDMEHMDGEPLALEDTLKYIGEIIDFKFESDWENEAEQRPRLNMVRALKSYMLRKHVNKRATDEQIKRLCASVLKWSEVNSRVKVFGMCAGMIDILTAWTERATCIWMLWLQELKKLSNPGLESQDPSTLGQSWTIFAPWLGTAEKVVELAHASAAAKAALDSNYSFGDLPDLDKAFGAAVVSVPGMTAGISLDKATELFMRAWFRQLENAKEMLVRIFEHFDDNNDQELDMQEFLALLKQTPLKIRQHDAMSMFNELAGPDGTMDEDEFAEILVFYKFNSRGLLGIDLEAAKLTSKDAAR